MSQPIPVQDNLPKDYPKHIGDDQTESRYNHKTIKWGFSFVRKDNKNRLALLKKAGLIVRVGSKTSGYWKVVGE